VAPFTHSQLTIMGVEERSVKASPLKLPLSKSEPLALANSVTAGGREIFKEVLLCLVGCQMQKLLQSCSLWTEATVDASDKATALVIICYFMLTNYLSFMSGSSWKIAYCSYCLVVLFIVGY